MDDITISFTIMTPSANCFKHHKMFRHDIIGPCVSLLILTPEGGGTVPLRLNRMGPTAAAYTIHRGSTSINLQFQKYWNNRKSLGQSNQLLISNHFLYAPQNTLYLRILATQNLFRFSFHYHLARLQEKP